MIGENPYKVIGVALTLAFVCGIGMVRFNMDGSPETLWNPIGSDVEKNQNWVDERFPTGSRYASVIAEDENVLSPDSLIKVSLIKVILSVASGRVSVELRSALSMLKDIFFQPNIIRTYIRIKM